MDERRRARAEAVAVDTDTVVVVGNDAGCPVQPRPAVLAGVGLERRPDLFGVFGLGFADVGAVARDGVAAIRADINDDVDAGNHVPHAGPAVPLNEQRGAFVGDDQIEPLVGALVEFPLDEPDGLPGGVVVQRVADEQSARAVPCQVGVYPAVRDGDEDAGVVVAEPGPAGLAIPWGNDGPLPVSLCRGLRGATDLFVTVCGDDQWGVFEDLPRERQCTHTL